MYVCIPFAHAEICQIYLPSLEKGATSPDLHFTVTEAVQSLPELIRWAVRSEKAQKFRTAPSRNKSLVQTTNTLNSLYLKYQGKAHNRS